MTTPAPPPESADGQETAGPDLSSLSAEARALLDCALEVLREYAPQPGALSGLPQIRIARPYTREVCRVMKDDARIGAKMLLCLAAVDYPAAAANAGGRHRAGRHEPAAEAADGDDAGGDGAETSAGRVEVVYILQSLAPERTLALKTEAPYEDPVVPSVTPVWRAADWYEREAHDLYGLRFDGHPDLSPLLLYDGFDGYPGRKEFPFYEYREF